jgi:molybdopterin synthase catalytic subunit
MSSMSTEILYAGLSANPIAVDQALAAVDAPDCGAVVSFSGVVRNHDGGRAVTRLSYSAHPLAERILAEVVEAVANEYTQSGVTGGLRIWTAHRVGPLEVGDAALVCAVAAAHRGAAFAACAAVVDRIKEQVPIWKEQFFDDGSVEWVGAGGAGSPAQPS